MIRNVPRVGSSTGGSFFGISESACGLFSTLKLLQINSVAKSMVEQFRSDNDTASTRIFGGFILGRLNWLKGYCQNLHITGYSRVLTNHLENEMASSILY